MSTIDFRNFGGTAYYQGGETIWNFGRFASNAHVEAVRRSLSRLYDEPQSFYDCAPHLRGYGVGRSINLHAIARKVLTDGIPAQYQNRGTCVSRGAKRTIDLVRCLAIYCGEGATIDDLTSHAYIYGDCREHGNFLGNQDGAVGAWAAWTVANDGNILNRDCQDSDNDDSLAVNWGLRGVPTSYKDKGRQHTTRRVIQLKSFDEVRDFLTAGLGGVTVASDVGYTTTRDRDGMCQASGSWNHQMCYTGYDSDRDALAQDQSWGPTQPDGPVFHCAGEVCPSYTFGVSRDDATRQISQGDTWGYAWVSGWTAQDVSWRP